MAKLIANKRVFIGFSITLADIHAPTALEVTNSINLTPLIVSLDASTRGNVVATPTLDTTFETSIAGTVTATFTAEFYRDDAVGPQGDLAWNTLPRGTSGYFIISRFDAAPTTGDEVEVWPVQITSRSAIALANNDSQRFSIECSVFEEPDEAAAIV